jgi:CNT family concentrative nucleoside transporter
VVEFFPLARVLLGVVVLLGLAWLLSDNRRQINWRLVAIGIAMQVTLAVFVLKVEYGALLFSALAAFFVKIIEFTTVGSDFVFGFLADQSLVTEVSDYQGGFLFVFQVLPTIIFFASLMSILYHLGIMQYVVRMMAWVMARLMHISGAESISVAANVFVGQTEAPLVVRPYIERMTRSELLTLMIGGMATIAGGVLAAYVTLLGGGDEGARIFYAKHLLSASLMAAPASIVVAKILRPETQPAETLDTVNVDSERVHANVIEAAAAGAADGLKLALNVAAMLLAFIAIIAMLNWLLAAVFSDWLGLKIAGESISFELLLGYLLAPLAWLIGVPWADAQTIGSLLGQKVVLNEFIAYLNLARQQVNLSPQAVLVATYALCGFANFSSIAIQIGGIGGIAENRRADIARNGLLAVFGGSIATMMTASIASYLASI